MRDRVAVLAKTYALDPARDEIDACIAKQARLDPVFRAWLAPKK